MYLKICGTERSTVISNIRTINWQHFTITKNSEQKIIGSHNEFLLDGGPRTPDVLKETDETTGWILYEEEVDGSKIRYYGKPVVSIHYEQKDINGNVEHISMLTEFATYLCNDLTGKTIERLK